MIGVYERIAVVSTILFVYVIVVSLMFAYWLVRPILRLTEVAERLRGDDLDARARITTHDEIGRLGSTLNEMATRMQTYIADIEKQYQIVEHEQNRLRASIESLDVGFIMTDLKNNIITINRVAKDIIAYEPASGGTTKIDINKQNWTTDMVRARLAKSFDLQADIDQAVSTSKPIEKREQNYNGRILRLFIAPIIEIKQDKTVNKLGVVILLDDITEAKILERSKDEFFSIASHELRTPLTSIRGNSSMILDFYKDLLKDDQLREMVDDMHTSSIG